MLPPRRTIQECVTGCLGSTPSNSCSGTDVPCLCKDQDFINGVATCLGSTCSQDDIAAGTQAAQALCQAAGVSVTLPTATAAGSSGVASTTAAASSSSASVSAASASFMSGASIASTASNVSAPSTASAAAATTSKAISAA
ncbi:hypothetical protein FRB95_003095 [Tulasnella sp. JGI-2019a]|nr:hypothetical protein FRB95_003095 [Tulasnella sp. JGI-2019a]